MNISSNPWSFVPGDIVTTTITSLTLNADGTVSAVVTSTAAFAAGNNVTVAFNTSLAGIYNGLYQIRSIGSGTTAVLIPTNPLPAGTGAAGASGVMSLCQYNNYTRVEDISWQSSGAPAPASVIGASDVLVITDRAGNLIWSAVAPVAAGTSFSQNRGKIFWVNGVTIHAMTHGIVLMTIN